MRYAAWYGVLLSIGILTSNCFASVPPHPRVIKGIKNGSLAVPYYLKEMTSLRAKGVNSSWVTPVVTNRSSKALEAASRFLGPAQTPVGSYRALLILVQFSDKPHQVSQNYFDSLIFGSQSGSMRDYYHVVSYGNLDVVTVNLPGALGWATAPNSYAYYCNGQNGLGNYPKNAQRLAEDVVHLVDPVIDFSKYDNDGDGTVDALFIVHTGSGAEYTGSNNDIWSHTWTIPSTVLDGVSISRYSIEPEYWASPGDMTIGIFAHEFGHAGFGLPDLYDTDLSSNGLGDWSLMAYGSWGGLNGNTPSLPDAWSRMAMGYATPVIYTQNQLNQVIPNVEMNSQIWKLQPFGLPSSEYYLVENRQQISYDTSLPANGLLIYHIDDSTSDNTKEWIPGDTSAGHYRVALEQPDGLFQLERNQSFGDPGDVFPGSAHQGMFDSSTIPSSRIWAGGNSYVGVRNISPSGSSMSADVAVRNIGGGPVRVTFETDPPGLSVTIDGSKITTPQTLVWETGILHQISTDAGQEVVPDSQWGWQNWNDGGALLHPVTVYSDTLFRAVFSRQYYFNGSIAQLSTGLSKSSAQQPLYCYVVPVSGYYNKGTCLHLEQRCSGGPPPAFFDHWVGVGNGSYSGTQNPDTICMNGPVTETAYTIFCSYSGPGDTIVTYHAGEVSAQILTQSPCPWISWTNDSWITVVPSDGTGSGMVHYSFTENPGSATRTGSVLYGADNFRYYTRFTIVQGGNPDPASLIFSDQPQNGIAGKPSSVTVRIVDSLGQPRLYGGIPVTITLLTGSGELRGTLNKISDSTGRVQFSDLSINAPGAKQLAAASPGFSIATSTMFTLQSLFVTVLTGDHGTSVPSGVIPVVWGDSLNIAMHPDSGYHVDSMIIDGISIGSNPAPPYPVPEYTFPNITRSHTMGVTFRVNTYLVTVLSGVHGIVNPGTTRVDYEQDQRFLLKPDSGFSLHTLIIDGIPEQDSIETYTFHSIRADHTLSAAFSENSLMTINCQTGWNLLSLPLLPRNSTRESIFPGAASRVFAYDGKYQAMDTLRCGVGYWVKYQSGQSINIAGQTSLSLSLGVMKGWNLIGSFGLPISTSLIGSIPPQMVVGKFFDFDHGYRISDTLFPSRGYWVKAGSPGILLFSADSSSTRGKRIVMALESGLPPLPPEASSSDPGIPPRAYLLGDAFPNPFNPTTTITYQLPVTSVVNLKVYNILGQTVANLVDEIQGIGYRTVSWDASTMSAGVYFYRLTTSSLENPSSEFNEIKKVIVVK